MPDAELRIMAAIIASNLVQRFVDDSSAIARSAAELAVKTGDEVDKLLAQRRGHDLPPFDNLV